MNLPSFDDFLSTLSKDKLDRIFNSINEEKISIAHGIISKEQADENINNLAFINLLICEGLLELYHEWLSEQLQNQ